ncbi:MAG: universal stress protein [Aequorivita sp.]
MRNILLPTDFSGNSKNAIRFAMKFFEGEPCTFHFLNTEKPTKYMTAEIRSSAPGSSVYKGILNDNKKELEKTIQLCESISEKEDFTFVPKVDFANITEAINQVVASHNIELIVMGTKGATGAAKALFGSNTIKVVRNVNCPVLAIPENYTFQEIKSILLSLNYQYDITDKNMEILLDIVKKHDATLKVLETLEKEEDIIGIGTKRKMTEEIFKGIEIERFAIKNLPAPMAISAFEQLIPIQLHAMIVDRESFLDRFISGSDTSKISYASRIPLLALK